MNSTGVLADGIYISAYSNGEKKKRVYLKPAVVSVITVKRLRELFNGVSLRVNASGDLFGCVDFGNPIDIVVKYVDDVIGIYESSLDSKK